MCEKRKSILFSIKSLILLIALAAILVLLTAITVSATVYSPWTRVAVDTTSTTGIQCAKVGDADYTQEQDFTWGVLAINTHKSIYLPDETASIGIAVLDNEGHMVCDADVTLTITDPSNNETLLSTSNGLIKVSPQCCVYGVTNLPDYYTNYTVDGAGTYMMNLTVTTVTANGTGTKSITDVFTVQNSVDFEVARDGATRIYPPVPYVMNFTIKANKDYDGLIREYVPASFVITPQDGLTVTTVGDTKILTWTKELVKGETYNIYYEFDAPDVSPYLFVLGELEIGNWEEARQWQIASDAIFVDGITTNGQDTSSMTFSHNTLTRPNLVLIVEVALDDGSSDKSVNTITYGGYSLTQLTEAAFNGGGPRVEVWYIIAPKTGSNNVIITIDGTNANKIGAAAISLSGVDQTTPVEGAQTDTGNVNNPSVSVTSETGDLVMDIESSEADGLSTVGAGQTKRWDQELGGTGVSSHYGQGSTEPGAASVTMSWTRSKKAKGAIIGFNINKAPAPTWVSYSDSGHTTECNDFISYETQHTVYMHGSGFTSGTDYRIIYWDETGANRKTDDKSSLDGTLSSSHTFVAGTDQPGTWYATVYYPDTHNPGSHDSGDANLVADHTFTVQQSAIPEFSTVLTAIAVCMLCAVAYMVMRRRAEKG